MADSNNLIQLLTPVLDQVQDVENALADLRVKRLLTQATGAQLDLCGDTVVLDRGAMGDSAYRAAILKKISYNMSCGQPNLLIDYLAAITDNTVEFYERQPATFEFRIHSMPSDMALFTDLLKMKPLGVGYQIIYYAGAVGDAFGFADEDGHVSRGKGFAEINWSGNDPGHLTERILNF